MSLRPSSRDLAIVDLWRRFPCLPLFFIGRLYGISGERVGQIVRARFSASERKERLRRGNAERKANHAPPYYAPEFLEWAWLHLRLSERT